MPFKPILYGCGISPSEPPTLLSVPRSFLRPLVFERSDHVSSGTGRG